MAGDGANVPGVRFPGFEGEWRNGNFASLGVLIIDGDRGENYPKSSDFLSNGYCLFLSAKNVTKHGFSFEETSFISEEKEQEMNKGKLVWNDIVLTTRGSLGHIALLEESMPYQHVRINSGMVILRCSADFDATFLYQQLRADHFQREVDRISFGSAQPQLTVGGISKIPLTLTSLPEQKKIAAFLGAVDGKIGLLEKKKALLEDYKKGCMQKLFSRTLRFKDDNGNDFPDWEEKRLGDVAIINPGSDELPISFTYIDLESVVSGKLNSPPIMKLEDAPSRAQRLLETGDILFQLVRPYQQNNLFFKLYGPHVASTGYAQVRAHKSKEFLFQALYSHEFLNEVLKRCTGTSYPAINSNDLREINILIPRSLKEQQKIANLLTAIDDKITLTANQLTQAQNFKKGLLQQMFV